MRQAVAIIQSEGVFMVLLLFCEQWLIFVGLLCGSSAVDRDRDGPDPWLPGLGQLRRVHISVQPDLDSDQHWRGEYKEQGNRIERRVEGDYGRLIDATARSSRHRRRFRCP